MSEVGRAIPAESAALHVSGRALYVDDLATRFSGLLHAWPVQAPHAHARVLSIQTDAARTMPGVVWVLTSRDVPGENDTGPARHDEPLLPSEVQYHGQAVAWVLAESEERAKLASLQVRVEYEPLPVIASIAAAMAAESFQSDELCIRRGQPEAELQRAPLRIAGEIEIGGQEHFYLEMHASIALRDASGGLHVYSSTQHPSETQAIVARVLGVPKHEIVCESPRMGGAFGGKEVQANAFAAVAALGAHVTGRPVVVRLDRRRDMTLTGKRHPFWACYEAGCSPEGKLLAAKLSLVSDGGYSLDLSRPVLSRALFHVDNAYLIPHLEVTGRVAKTHKTSQTAFRGFGGPQGMVVIEEILDHIARKTGLAPHEVRARNFYRDGDCTHYGQRVTHAERIARIDSELKASSDFEQRITSVDAFNAANTTLKRGLAITPVKFGISFTTAFFNQAGALVLIYQDGSVQVNHGGTEMGQGLTTKIRQIAADALGLKQESIRVMSTRTDKVPNTSATAASTGSDLNGAAVHQACTKLRERLSQVAARLLDAAPDEVLFECGEIYRQGRTERRVPFAKVVARAYLERVQLFASGHYATPGIHFDEERGRGEPFHYFCFGGAASEVEVDGETGEYRLLRVDLLADAGNSLSPMIDIGQVEGGFVQGVGWLTREDLRWDEQGKLLTVGASSYKLPALSDIPEAFHTRLLQRAAEPGVIYGSKAVGEPPFMLALSVREALRAAVAAFASTAPARVTLGCPATPEQVLWAIDRVRAT